MQIKFKGIEPIYMTEGAAGADIFSNDEIIVIKPRSSAIIKSGTFLELPSGYEAQVRPRSGLAFKNDVVCAFGTIDSDYRGEINVKLFNFSDSLIAIQKGDRIAQIIIQKVEQFKFVKTNNKFTQTERGANGFGSTGI